ncbi:Hcp family type VI secretion system effector [Pseudomonas japonica]|uniref:Hcp family type VI secretion system effector n=1 Tax=Pseudomonas japonica TaxID=256466 RepID=UPI00381D7DEA
MAIPVYLWLQDDGGTDIKGSVNVIEREGSVEVVAFDHALATPTDANTGKVTGSRTHAAFRFTKEIDASTPYLYKAVTSAQTLKKALFRFYRINEAGREVEYFSITLEGVKVVGVAPKMLDIKNVDNKVYSHLEVIELRYEKITWAYNEGNIVHSDAWDERPGDAA